jgi:hypothetical protein
MHVLHGLDEAARMLGGISVWTLRKHISQGGITPTRLGRRVFLSSAEVERIQKEGLPSLRTEASDRTLQEEFSSSKEMVK